MGLFDRLIFVGASCSLVGAFIYFRREKRFSQMMKDVNEMTVVEFDKIFDYSQLPADKMIALRATVEEASLKNGRVNKGKEVAFSTLAVAQKPTQMFAIMQGLSFNIVNPQGLTLNVSKVHGKSAIFYDIHKISEEFKYNQYDRQAPLNLVQRIQDMRGTLKFAEYAILPSEQYIIVGRISSGMSKPIIEPKIIMGDNKIAFLKSLDLFLAKNSQKGKYCLFSVVGMVGCHYALTRLFPDVFRSKRQVAYRRSSSSHE